MSDASNIDEVVAKLKNLADCLDFTRAGEQQSLGRDMLAEQAVMISERAELEQGPQGAWRENQGDYGVAKRDMGLPIGRGFGPDPADPEPDYIPMLSLQLLQGRQTITKDEASMQYGLGTDNDRKAQWYTQGSQHGMYEHSGAQNQPPRPFYEMVDSDMDWLAKMAEDGIAKFLAEEFGATEKF